MNQILLSCLGVIGVVACRPARPLIVEDNKGFYYFQDSRTGQTVGGPYHTLYFEPSKDKPQPLPRRMLLTAWDSTQHGLPWLINAWGKRTVRAFFFDSGPDHVKQGLMRYTNDSVQVGFANRRGHIKIPAQFTIAYPFQKGYSIVGQGSRSEPLCPGDMEHQVWRGGRWGIIDRRGRVVVPLDYDAIFGVAENDNWSAAVKGADTILINRRGKRLSSRAYRAYTYRCSSAYSRPAKADSTDEWRR